MLLAMLAGALTGCSRLRNRDGDAPTEAPTELPEATSEVGSHGETDQSAALEVMPTLEPAQTLPADVDGGFVVPDEDAYEAHDDSPEGLDTGFSNLPADPGPTVAAVPTLDTSTYQFSALMDTSLGFTFNYPSHWENVPGIFTVCFRESVEEGDFPARVAVSVKKLAHRPEEDDIADQLSSFVRTIYRQYDADTFVSGTANLQDVFLGTTAFSNTYLAFSGENEVKGFIIGCAIKNTMYVFHFCAEYDDYVAMESMMRYMINSVRLLEEE